MLKKKVGENKKVPNFWSGLNNIRTCPYFSFYFSPESEADISLRI